MAGYWLVRTTNISRTGSAYVIMEKVAQEKLKIHHKCIEAMCDDVNIKPFQGIKIQVMRGTMMGITIE